MYIYQRTSHPRVAGSNPAGRGPEFGVAKQPGQRGASQRSGPLFDAHVAIPYVGQQGLTLVSSKWKEKHWELVACWRCRTGGYKLRYSVYESKPWLDKYADYVPKELPLPQK